MPNLRRQVISYFLFAGWLNSEWSTLRVEGTTLSLPPVSCGTTLFPDLLHLRNLQAIEWPPYLQPIHIHPLFFDRRLTVRFAAPSATSEPAVIGRSVQLVGIQFEST